MGRRWDSVTDNFLLKISAVTHKILLNFCATPTRLASLRLSIASLIAIKPASLSQSDMLRFSNPTRKCLMALPRLRFSRSFKTETVGFEPTVPIKGRLVSSEVLSTTQPRLHILYKHCTIPL